MKIENFDTGLKGQGVIENIIITPEENYRNKQKIKNYLSIKKEYSKKMFQKKLILY